MRRRVPPELIVLAVAAAFTRFWRLFTPRAVVFDEMHYKHHAGHYLAGTHYFDVHPPLAKLLYALVAKLAGVPAETLLGDSPVVVLRVLPAAAGTLIVPLSYVMLRQLGASRRTALFGGFCILVENALIADARFALIEPILICFALGALTLFFAGRRSSGRRRTILVGAAAFMAGCALSCKWTGASALGLMFCVWLRDAYRDRSQLRRAAVEAAMLIVVPIVVYVSVFAIHFALIKRAGVDESIMSPQYRATLVGSPSYNPAAHMSFWAKLRDIHRAIGIGNRQLQFVTHPASSPWYTWPIMKHPIGLWENKDAAPGTKQMIILLGNPLLWWAPLGVLAISLARFRRREHLSEDQRFAVAFLLGGILINFVPFMAITRVMYIYHYLFAMLWGVLLATYVAGVWAPWTGGDDEPLFRFATTRAAAVYWSAAAVILVSFLYFSPFTFGFTLSQAAHDARFTVLHPF